jgi:hypothetical protein
MPGIARLIAFDGRLHRSGRIPRRRADRILELRQSEQQHGADAEIVARRASSTASRTRSCQTPGIDPISTFGRAFGTTNSG